MAKNLEIQVLGNSISASPQVMDQLQKALDNWLHNCCIDEEDEIPQVEVLEALCDEMKMALENDELSMEGDGA